MSLNVLLRAGMIAFTCLFSLIFHNLAYSSSPLETVPDKIETSVFAVSSDRELREALTLIGEDLKRAQVSNHALTPEIIIKQPTQDSQRPRLVMAIARGFVSGMAVSWTLAISSDVILDQAITVAVLPGISSFLLHYNLQKVQDYLGQGKSLLGKCMRWLSIETAFLTILSGTLNLSGIKDLGVEQNLIWILSTAALGLTYQGIWDITITDKRNEDLKDRSAYSIRKTEIASSAKALAVAFVSVAIATANSQADLQTTGYAAALVMGALGLRKYILQKVAFRRAQPPKGLCQFLFDSAM